MKEVTAPQLIRYALSLEGPTGCAIGMDSLDVVKQNIDLLKGFSPMKKEEMDKMQVVLAPFFRHEGLEWMQPGYRDGYWA